MGRLLFKDGDGVLWHAGNIGFMRSKDLKLSKGGRITAKTVRPAHVVVPTSQISPFDYGSCMPSCPSLV